MAALPPIEGVLKCEISGNIAGNTYWANILHFGQLGEPWLLANMISFYDAMESSQNALYTGNMGAAVVATEVKLTDLSSDTGEVYAVSVDWTGGRIGISAQASACVLATYQISRRYRGGHPRTYFPFGDAALQEDPQSWDEAFVANVATNLEAVLTAAAGFSDASVMGCPSYFSGGVERVTPLWQPFTGSAVDIG